MTVTSGGEITENGINYREEIKRSDVCINANNTVSYIEGETREEIQTKIDAYKNEGWELIGKIVVINYDSKFRYIAHIKCKQI